MRPSPGANQPWTLLSMPTFSNTLPAWHFEPCFWQPATASSQPTWRSIITSGNTVHMRRMDNDNSHVYDGLRKVLKLHRTFPFGVGHLCFPALFPGSCIDND